MRTKIIKHVKTHDIKKNVSGCICSWDEYSSDEDAKLGRLVAEEGDSYDIGVGVDDV